jgi:hypothetical protein
MNDRAVKGINMSRDDDVWLGSGAGRGLLPQGIKDSVLSLRDQSYGTTNDNI